MKVLVIIPAYNEELNITHVVEDIKKEAKNKKYTIDYLIINDGSTDNTLSVCLKNNYPVINLIHNLGIGGAVQTGYQYALLHNYDIAIQFDGDGQHDATFIDKLVMPIIKKEADMTIGSRYLDNSSSFKSTKLRQAGIKFLSFILIMTTNQKIYDMTSGFRAVNKNIIKLFAHDYPSDYPEPESIVTVLKKCNVVKEIPVNMKERMHGTSSITPLKSIYYMAKVSYAMVIRSLLERKDN